MKHVTVLLHECELLIFYYGKNAVDQRTKNIKLSMTQYDINSSFEHKQSSVKTKSVWSWLLTRTIVVREIKRGFDKAVCLRVSAQ